MNTGIYKMVEEFEKEICKYTGAPYAITIDSCSNALFLALKFEKVEGVEITIPSRTYPSVPCEIIHAGGKVKFKKIKSKSIKGAYQLEPTCVWDSALRFTHDMYIPGTHLCLSFTGPSKHLKLGKGGAILTDNKKAAEWFRRARYSGRTPGISYHNENFDMIGWNFVMMPEIALRGLSLIKQFYTQLGSIPIPQEDVELSYPDLSQFPIYQSEDQ